MQKKPLLFATLFVTAVGLVAALRWYRDQSGLVQPKSALTQHGKRQPTQIASSTASAASADTQAVPAATPSPQAPFSQSVAVALPVTVFGTRGEVTLEDVPSGRFHHQLVKLSPAARSRALRQLGDDHVPFNDVVSLHADAAGYLFYACDFTLAGAQPVADTDQAERLMRAESVQQAPIPISSPPVRHSKPGAPNVIYLDFNGHTITGTAWNGSVATYVAKPYDKDGDPTTFNDSEQTDIILIWERVAEDYKPFNVDVTTEDPVTFNSHTGRVLITQSVDANGQLMPSSSAGGVAYVGVFGGSNYVSTFSPALVYADHLGPYGQSYIAEAASHEMGHNMGLSHDGLTSGASYYGGHGTGETSWGPIMGTGYGRNVSQWSKGEYYNANNPEDDLAIIAGKLGYRTDDAGDTNATAVAMAVSGTTISASGIISQTGEGDRFSFTTGTGNVSITGSPYRCSAGTYGGNLDVKLELIDTSNTVVATANPTATTGATLSAAVAGGTYFVRVSGVGVGSPLSATPDGYTSYGSLGAYTLSGTVAANSPPAFTTQPLPKSVRATFPASFTVATSGFPTPTWQWQRLPAGSSTWANLTNAGPYSGVTTLTLSVTGTTVGMSGDQFRCVATNASGSATSGAASLTVTLAGGVVVNDFNGDGKSDLLWENTATGDRQFWLMNGTTLSSVVSFGNLSTVWRIAATGDFNGDNQTDVVWENTSTGERAIWLMNGTTMSSSVSFGVIPLAWRIAAAADFNNDGKTDIVWENSATGERAIWLMNGTVFSAGISFGNIPNVWRIAAAGDFNGDGKPDIVWENTVTGEHALWLMNGTVFTGAVSFGITPTAWRLASVGDYNSDGNTDMLWQNTVTGDRGFWLMNGTSYVTWVDLGIVPVAWRIAR